MIGDMEHPPLPPTRMRHRGDKVDPSGRVSALCFSKPRPINMKRESWTLSDAGVTCLKCRALIDARGKPPNVGGNRRARDERPGARRPVARPVDRPVRPWCRSERTAMEAIERVMAAHDDVCREQLERIGRQIGYGRAQQILGELWDAMLDREYPPPPGVSRSGRGRMGVTANLHVGQVVIGPSPIDGKEGFTMIRWNKDRGCPPVGTRLYVEKLHPANR